MSKHVSDIQYTQITIIYSNFSTLKFVHFKDSKILHLENHSTTRRYLTNLNIGNYKNNYFNYNIIMLYCWLFQGWN